MKWLTKLMGNAPNDAAQTTPAPGPLSAPKLEQSIRSLFLPILRADGFAGSSRTFHRLAGDMIQVVQVQGARWGSSFAISLGVHPTCIPVLGDAPQKKIKPELCILRRRLSTGSADQWWEHRTSGDSMDSAIKDAAAVFVDFGRPAFENLTGPNSSLRTLTPAQFEAGQFDFFGFKSTDVLMAKMLALIRLADGDSQSATAFARIALDRIGPALGQLRELTAIEQGAWRKEDW